MTATLSARLHPPTVADICASAGISRRMYFNARTVHWAGCPELIRRMRDGDITMNLALELVRFNHDSQRLIMAEFHDIPSRERLAFVRRVWDGHVKEVESASREPAGFAIGLPSHAHGMCHPMSVPIVAAGSPSDASAGVRP